MFEQAFKNIDDVLWKDQTGLGQSYIRRFPASAGMNLNRRRASLDEYVSCYCLLDNP